MTGKIVQITPERAKELNQLVTKSAKGFDVFTPLATQANYIQLEFDNYTPVLHYKNNVIEIKFSVFTDKNEYVILTEITTPNKVDNHSCVDAADQYFHHAFYKALIIAKSYFDAANRLKKYASAFKAVSNLFEVYRTWINENYYEIRQIALPLETITAQLPQTLPQTLPTVTEELPAVERGQEPIPAWIRKLEVGQSVWVAHPDYKNYQLPDGNRCYFDLVQFKAISEPFGIRTNKCRKTVDDIEFSIHHSYIYPTGVEFQFFCNDRNYINNQAFTVEEFASKYVITIGKKSIDISKYLRVEKTHEILINDLDFNWFTLLEEMPNNKKKPKKTPATKVKEIPTPTPKKELVEQLVNWKFSQDEAINFYAAAKGHQMANEVLLPFFKNAKLDDAIPFHFKGVKMCCTYCDEAILPNQPSWLVSNNSSLYYVYCNNTECAGGKRYKPFITTPKLELTQPENKVDVPGKDFRERYNNKKMLKRLINQLEEMPNYRRAYLINSINNHFNK